MHVKIKAYEKILEILEVTKVLIVERAGGIAYFYSKINHNIQFPLS